MVLDDGKEGARAQVTVDETHFQAEATNGAVVEKGKRQELRRNFQFFSIWGYAVILGCTWEWGLASGVFSLTNGGTAGAIWMFLVVCFGMFFVMISFAEAASIAPTSGGQYHWVSEFSPRKHQKVLSYVTGWFALLGWQTSLVGTAYAAGQQFEAMAALSDPNYTIEGWQGCLFTVGLTTMAIFFNTVLFSKLPFLEGIIIVFHCFGFLAVVVTLWVMGPRGGSETVTSFSDNGWGSVGLSCLVGILSPLITLVGADSQCHLSEELHDAAYVLPRAMVATACANYVMGFVMVLTIMFTIGPDVQSVLNTPFGQPWVQIVYNATNSYAASMTFALVVGLLLTCCLINNVTTASRQLWSFARDGGVPFGAFFAKVRPGWDVPVNAMAFTWGITVILSLVIIGSPVAFSILTSLSLTGLISSYLLAVCCIFAKRIRGEQFPPGRFNLGRFGFVANGVAVCFLVVAWLFMFFPTAPNPGLIGMNWSVVIYGFVVALFTIYFFVRGRHQYVGPVEHAQHLGSQEQQRGAGYKPMDEDTPPAEPGFEEPRTTTIDYGNTVVRSASEYLPNVPASTVPALVDEPSPTGNGDGAAAPTLSRSNKASVDAQGRILNPRSCVTCRKRKVKCDKIHPSCSNCNRAHIECVFPAPGRAPRKARKLGDGRDKELLERLRRLEGVVKGLGVDVPLGGSDVVENGEHQPAESKVDRVVREETVDDEALDAEEDAPKPHANGVSDTSPELDRLEQNDFQAKTRYVEEQQSGRFDNGFGRLVINDGRSRYINNSFWASLSNEVEDLKGIFNQSSDEEDDAETGADPLVTNHQGWVFGFSSQNVDMLALHPIPGQIALYWDIFKDRVDPLVKVLHVPTVETAVLNSAPHLSTLSRGFEALLFAIYYGAVTSLTAEDCKAKLNEDKQILLSRYRFAFEQSLARANFLTTEEIVVLQAFVIFLICLRRNHDARVIWTLTGLVVRISQTLGIHRDGLHFAGGLSPFEIEMRRRLWWQICTLDIRASEDHGCDPTITEQLFDTKMPLNINDEDIGPSSPDFPPERQGCTGISFCLIRFEVANTFRRINYVPPGTSLRTGHGSQSGVGANITLADKEKWIAECHERLEERYLKHCDMSVPLFWVTATIARLMMSKMWLMVYHPFQRQDGGASLPAETKDKLFITSLENIEYSLLLETEARTMKWGWLFRTYMQWHALAFMLSELCHRSTGDLVERAWVAVEKTRDGRWGRPLGADARAGHLWRPLRKLYRKAREARQRGMAEERLEKQRGLAPPLSATRTYSPNPNPMFGYPKRSQVTRAPLSQAQVLRFSQGPSYGDMPMDKHEWLRSPKLPSTGQDDVEAMDTADLPCATMTTNSRPAISGSQTPSSDGTFSAPLRPSKATTMRPSLEQPGFTNSWMNNGVQYGQHASNGSVGYTTDQNSTAASTAMDLSGMAGPDLRLPNQMGSMDTTGFDFDPGILDTTGEVNWQNWDELVRQFGMDVDTTFDRRPSDVGIDGLPDDGWTMAPNPAQANLRMGLGMGGGDWF